MSQEVAAAKISRLISTPHPVSLEGQQNIEANLEPGEKLGAFLRRTVPGWCGDAWEVRINGVLVPYQVMEHVRPKPGAVIEARGLAKKQALYIVALAALTYFTFGLGAGVGGAWGAAGGLAGAVGGGVGGALLATAVYMGGPSLGKKVIS